MFEQLLSLIHGMSLVLGGVAYQSQQEHIEPRVRWCLLISLNRSREAAREHVTPHIAKFQDGRRLRKIVTALYGMIRT